MTSLVTFTPVRRLGALLPVCLLSSCALLTPEPAWKAAVAGDGPGDPQRVSSAAVMVKNLPKSPRGNAASYTVFGQAYRVLDSAKDFEERGEASWYGKKFHGRETASGEVYDMHELTAAHKHLPLPTFVRVTRIDNGQSVIVKVNDRGPFVDDRVIDLSYAAASHLNMLEGGKSDVFIQALSHHEGAVAMDDSAETLPDTSTGVTRSTTSTEPAGATGLAVEPVNPGRYLQVGAYAQISNAQRMLDSVTPFLSAPAGINHDPARNLYRVKIGPLPDDSAFQQTKESLALAGIESYTLVSVSP